MIAIDTNLLVYAHRLSTSEHTAARNAIERACTSRQGWGTTLPNLTEFWSIVTHPASGPRPSSEGEAAAFIQSLIEDGGGAVWEAEPDFGDRLMQTATDLQIRGSRIFDLQIALIAFENGAREIWTHDHNFVQLRGLRLSIRCPSQSRESRASRQ